MMNSFKRILTTTALVIGLTCGIAMNAQAKLPADMEEYLDMLFLSECHKVKYPAIKRWFLNRYPDVVRYGVKEALISNSQCAA